LGPEHRTSPLVAIKSHTLWSAYQHFEEKSKGSLEVGKLADFVILESNPLTVDPMEIANIKVLETIKEGKTVYRRAPANGNPASLSGCAESTACYKLASYTLGKAGLVHSHDHDH
jgi:adenine deaminase